jgi:hypothetical protein
MPNAVVERHCGGERQEFPFVLIAGANRRRTFPN